MYPSLEGLERLSWTMGSHLMAKINIPIDREIGAYKNKHSPAGIGSKKLSSQVQLTLRLVLLRKVSSEKPGSQIQSCLRLLLLRKIKNPAMFQNQSKWSLRHPFSKLSLQIYFEDTWGSWLGLGIFILIRILSFVPCPMFQILALYLNFKGAKNPHVL